MNTWVTRDFEFQRLLSAESWTQKALKLAWIIGVWEQERVSYTITASQQEGNVTITNKLQFWLVARYSDTILLKRYIFVYRVVYAPGPRGERMSFPVNEESLNHARMSPFDEWWRGIERLSSSAITSDKERMNNIICPHASLHGFFVLWEYLKCHLQV